MTEFMCRKCLIYYTGVVPLAEGKSSLQRVINKWYTGVEEPKRHYCLFVFVALRPMSTAMVIAGRSVHLTTLFPGQA